MLYYYCTVLCVTAVEELFRPTDPNDRQKSGDGRLVLKSVIFVRLLRVYVHNKPVRC